MRMAMLYMPTWIKERWERKVWGTWCAQATGSQSGFLSKGDIIKAVDLKDNIRYLE